MGKEAKEGERGTFSRTASTCFSPFPCHPTHPKKKSKEDPSEKFCHSFFLPFLHAEKLRNRGGEMGERREKGFLVPVIEITGLSAKL